MIKLCKCGCGKEATHGDWTKGHCNRGQIKEVIAK